jgi:hypothetical protein
MQDKTQNASATLSGSISPDQQQHGTSGAIAPFFLCFQNIRSLLTYPPIRTLEVLVDQGDCPYSVNAQRKHLIAGRRRFDSSRGLYR